MTSTVITCPELHERPDDYIKDKLFTYVPMFRQHMDRSAGSLIGDLESIIQHKLYERVGYDSMESYAREQLLHSEQWCHEVIRIYREDWSPEQRAKLRVADLVASVEPAKPHGGTGANQYTKEKGSVDNINSAKPAKKRKGGTDPEYVIARLKRDQATDPKAGFLLAGIERGDIKPYRAAIEMGWIKQPTQLDKAKKSYQSLNPEDTARFRAWLADASQEAAA